MFKRIVVHLDGSERAEKVIPYVVEMATLCSSRMHLVVPGSHSAPVLVLDWCEKRHGGRFPGGLSSQKIAALSRDA